MEIERKFLTSEELFNNYIKDYSSVCYIEDIYLLQGIRIRKVIQDKKTKYFLTQKSEGTLIREEYEEELPITNTLLELFQTFPTLTKLRYKVRLNDQIYEFNKFLNIKIDNKPLYIVEIELESENEAVISLGKEVTEDVKCYGYNLWACV